MALTRKLLKGLGLEENVIDTIIDAHTETVDGLKADRDGFKQTAETVPSLQAEVTRLTGELETAKQNGGDAASVQAEFDAYKQQVEGRELRTRKDAALDKVMKKAGILRESFRAQLRKGWDLDTLEFGEGDELKNADQLENTIKTDYADFISTTDTTGTPPANPPTGGSTGSERSGRAAELARQYHENLYGKTKE